MSNTVLQLEKLLIPGTSAELYYDTSAGKPRPYLPSPLRPQVFNSLHSLSHPGIKATAKLISQRFVWPAIQKYCRTWARACQPCQRSEASRHTITPFGYFPLPPARFLHIHIDLSRSSTIIGRISVLPHCSGPPHAFAGILPYSRQYSRGSVTPPTLRLDITFRLSTDHHNQGRQFESQLFHNLAKLCEIHLCRTSPHHSAANGLVETLHRTLKAAIMCHADEQWTEALQLVLLGIRTAYKEDLQSSEAEIVYGEPMPVPGELTL